MRLFRPSSGGAVRLEVRVKYPNHLRSFIVLGHCSVRRDIVLLAVSYCARHLALLPGTVGLNQTVHEAVYFSGPTYTWVVSYCAPTASVVHAIS